MKKVELMIKIFKACLGVVAIAAVFAAVAWVMGGVGNLYLYFDIARDWKHAMELSLVTFLCVGWAFIVSYAFVLANDHD